MRAPRVTWNAADEPQSLWVGTSGISDSALISGFRSYYVADPEWHLAGADFAKAGLCSERLEMRHLTRHAVVAVQTREQSAAQTVARALGLSH